MDEDEDEVGVATVGSALIGSCGDGTEDFLLLPKLSWLSERGKRARKVGGVTVVVVVTVTLEDAVVIIAMRDAVELYWERRR